MYQKEKNIVKLEFYTWRNWETLKQKKVTTCRNKLEEVLKEVMETEGK